MNIDELEKLLEPEKQKEESESESTHGLGIYPPWTYLQIVYVEMNISMNALAEMDAAAAAIESGYQTAIDCERERT